MRAWLTSLTLRLRARRRGQLERDLRDEMSFHLAMREEQVRQDGRDDARAVARRRFGSQARIGEELRDLWAVAPRLSSLCRDLGYAARALRGGSGFASIVVLTLGLGIGATTAFFTVVNAVLLRPLGYAEPDRLVSILEGFPGAGVERLPFSALDFADLARHQRAFEAVAAYRTVPFELSGVDTPLRITGAKVSSGLFELLGVAPVLGRTFHTEDDRPGVHVALLSWGLWQRRYGGHASVVGQRVQLDRQSYTVIGVMPAGFVFPRRGPQFNGEAADVWVPIAFTDRERAERGSMHANSVIGRLRPGVDLRAAAAELDLIAPRIAEAYPAAVLAAGLAPRLTAQPYRDEISGRLRRPLLVLLAAVGLVLLVACANVANLVLSRTTARTREFAVRTALGAGRSRIVQLLLCEGLLLACAGGAVGIALAYALVRSAPAVLARTVPGLHDIPLDWRVLAFTAAICLATTVLFALVPVPTLDRRRPADALRDESGRSTGVRKLRLQRGFVVATVCLACVLLVGAGLATRSFAALMATSIGFRPARVLTASTTLPRTSYATAASVRTFHQELTSRLAALPGVTAAALATDLPLTTYELRVFSPEGADPAAAAPTTNLTWVHGPYFEALGMSLASGRFFLPDEHAQNRRVVVVNEQLASQTWPGQPAVGRRLKLAGQGSGAPWLTVVGVVRDVADGPIGTAPKVHAYEPFRQFPDFALNGAVTQFGRDVKVALLTSGDPRALAGAVRQQVAALDGELAIETLQPMDDLVADVVAPQRFSARLVSLFAAVALLLASVGLYGLMAYVTAQRRNEIAVRMALGAERRAVIGMVVGQGARLVGAGMVLGLAASLALTRVVGSLLHQQSADFLPFAAIPLVLAPAALLACALPAWRAARIEPVAALRAE